MATPNYGNQQQMGMGQPQQPQQQHPGMQQMQQPGMSMGGPQGAVPPPRPVRRGTSKAVPVVMSAGLAIGVFCGLLFGLGTGNDGAIASPSTASSTDTADKDTKDKDTKDTKPTEVADVLKSPSAADGTAKPVEPPPPNKPVVDPATGSAGSGSAAPAAGSDAPVAGMAVAAAGSGTTPAVGSNAAAPAAGSGATPAVVADKAAAKLKIEIVPPDAATGAKITVDGKDFTADMAVALDGAAKKTVAISIKTTSYKDYDQKIDVTPGDTIVKVELVKKPVAVAGTPATPTGAKPSGGNSARPVWTGTQTIPAGGAKPSGGSKPSGGKPSGGKPAGGKPSGGLIDI